MSTSNAYFVPLIPQTTKRGCWAASIAMIKSWKSRISYYTPENVSIVGSTNYKLQLTSGLDSTDKKILRLNGFEIVSNNSSLNIEFISRILRKKGPLWFARWAPGPHVSVITGNSGNKIFINDPWPPNRGKQIKVDFAAMMKDVESLHLGGVDHAPEHLNSVYFAYLK